MQTGLVIKHVEAVRLLDHSAQGQTVPLILDCVDPTGEQRIFQVKLSSKRSGLSARELCCEMVCTELSESLSFNVARPAWVSLGKDIIERIEYQYGFEITESIAAGVSRVSQLRPFLIGADDLLNHLAEGSGMAETAARLLALDLIFANGDRTPANPNLAFKRDELFIFDFEHCLELPRRSYETAFDVHMEQISVLQRGHVFASAIRRERLLFAMSHVTNRLPVLIEQIRIAGRRPNQFHNEWSWILDYLDYLAAHRDVILRMATAE